MKNQTKHAENKDAFKMTFDELNDAAIAGTIEDEENPLFLFSGVRRQLLEAILDGRLDAKAFAKRELDQRM